VLWLIASWYANGQIAAPAADYGRNGQDPREEYHRQMGANDRTHAVAIPLKRGIMELWSLERVKIHAAFGGFKELVGLATLTRDTPSCNAYIHLSLVECLEWVYCVFG